MHRLFLLITLLFTCIFSLPAQQKIIPLYSGNIPNSNPTDEVEKQTDRNFLWIQNVVNPDLAIYLPASGNKTGQAVVICPGGGYAGLAYDWEGSEFAKWFNTKGISAFVLKYRLPRSSFVTIPHNTPLLDAQRAIRLVRSMADSLGIDKNKVGIMGFSAGGHLASTAGTHFDNGLPDDPDQVNRESSRPDFMALIYPVITMKPTITHQGSHDNLIGKDADDAMVNLYSNETQVNSNTPPTFIIHAADDNVVPLENALWFHQALYQAGVPSEMHIFPTGGHGFGLGLDKPHLTSWVDLLYTWMHEMEN